MAWFSAVAWSCSAGMNVLLEASYRLGLSNLFKDPEPGVSVKPTALSLLLGVKF